MMLLKLPHIYTRSPPFPCYGTIHIVSSTHTNCGCRSISCMDTSSNVYLLVTLCSAEPGVPVTAILRSLCCCQFPPRLCTPAASFSCHALMGVALHAVPKGSVQRGSRNSLLFLVLVRFSLYFKRVSSSAHPAPRPGAGLGDRGSTRCSGASQQTGSYS